MEALFLFFPSCISALLIHYSQRAFVTPQQRRRFTLCAVILAFGLSWTMLFATPWGWICAALAVVQLLWLTPVGTQSGWLWLWYVVAVSVLWLGVAPFFPSVRYLIAAVQCALFPFHRWLLATTDAPTPASALLHAGFVQSGITTLWHAQPDPLCAQFVFLYGALSVLVGAGGMLTEAHRKKKLCYSTLFQTGICWMQVGCGLWDMALLHALFHGCYKAWSFCRLMEKRAPPPTPYRPVWGALFVMLGWFLSPVLPHSFYLLLFVSAFFFGSMVWDKRYPWISCFLWCAALIVSLFLHQIPHTEISLFYTIVSAVVLLVLFLFQVQPPWLYFFLRRWVV